jgi:hypothetical protein
MAEQNRDWGYRRIQGGALSNLGHEIARSTIAAILERHGIGYCQLGIRWRFDRPQQPLSC